MKLALTIKEHYKINLTLALPVMLSQMGHILVSVADSMMVGRLGAIPLASVALANSLITVIMLFGLGVSYGMTPLVASSDGASDIRGGAVVLKNGFVLNVILGFALIFVSYITGFGLFYMGQDAEVLAGTMPYFKVLAWSLLPMMIFQTFRQFAEGLSMTKQAMYISISGNVINVILNYGLIFGKLGMPQYGVIGAGYATLISRIVMALAMGVFVWTYGKMKIYRDMLSAIQIEWVEIRKILRIGVPSGMQYVFEVGAFGMAAIIIGWTGAIPLAAHQIALNLAAISYMTATGISAASSIRVGNQLGKKDFKTLREAGMTCFVMAAVMMTGFALVFVVFQSYLPELYVDDIEVIQMASSLLVVAAFFQISDGVQAVGLGVLRGLRDVNVPTYVTLIAYWGTAMPLGYWLGITLGMGAVGVWWGLLIGLTIAAIAHLFRFNSLTNKMIRGVE